MPVTTDESRRKLPKLMLQLLKCKMVHQLLEDHETVARTARGLIPLVDKAGDEVSADLLTQRMQLHEKTAWMLRSFLEA